MKLPFDFGIKLIFRLAFPGAILAAAMVPAVHAILHALGICIKFEYLFPIEVIAWGWAIVVSDMPIYMLFEGRRYWPPPLRQLLMWCQRRRLKRLSDIVLNRSPNLDRRRSLEAGVEYGFYPIDKHSTAYVQHPTRLGNIIETFETYPNIKYGLDGVFYWYRLWVVLDKDLREEIDSSQAVVDSTVYISFVLYVSAVVMLVYAGIRATAHLNWPYMHWLSAIELPNVLAASVLCGMAAACLVIGFAVYRLSLPAHAKFGELFKSVFDQYRSKLVFDDVLKEVACIMGDQSLRFKSQREKNQIVWRYLRWHMLRDEATGRNLTVKEWKDHKNPPRTAGAP
jgi:hypothetical protein